jgi:8-oxo-dGTP pyrophosphatase MutT (NUDIX family)
MFVERAAGMRTHPGQIAFPGGAADADDHDLADTALREAAEETGVDRSGIDVLGVLPPAYVEVSGFDVTAVIAWWREPSPVAVIDSREAASIDIVPVAVLTDPAHRARVQHPSGYTGPAFEVNGHLIWGLTAHLLDGVLDLAGWQRPWDRHRVVPIPARYLTDSRPDRGGPDAH